jgi:hypothetical protein
MAARESDQPGMAIASLLWQLAGLLGPFAAAMILTLASGERRLGRDFRARLSQRSRIRPAYLPAIFLLMPLALVGATLISLRLGLTEDQFHPSAGLVRMAPVILLAPTFEEFGWRGYGMDSLRARLGLTPATLVFALLWALWHAPLFFIDHNYQHGLIALGPIYVADFFVSVLPAAILSNWIYYRNDRSILAAIGFHMVLVAASEALQTDPFTKLIVTGLLLAASGLVVLMNRRLFAEGPKAFV